MRSALHSKHCFIYATDTGLGYPGSSPSHDGICVTSETLDAAVPALATMLEPGCIHGPPMEPRNSLIGSVTTLR